MPSSTEELTVVSTIKPLQVGEIFPSLSKISHITLFPWMILEAEKLDDFYARMNDLLVDNPARTLVGGEEDEFGPPEKRKRVRKLEGLDLDIRNDLANIAIDLGGRYDPTFTEHNTVPHIADTPEYAVDKGEVISISELTVIAKHAEEMRIVRAIYKLRKL